MFASGSGLRVWVRGFREVEGFGLVCAPGRKPELIEAVSSSQTCLNVPSDRQSCNATPNQSFVQLTINQAR